MNSAVLSPAGVALLCAHPLLRDVAPMLKGLGLQQRTRAKRLVAAIGLPRVAQFAAANAPADPNRAPLPFLRLLLPP